MMSGGSVSAAVNPCARRKERFKPKNSSPGNSPQVKHWNCESHDAAAPRCNSATGKTLGDQRSSPSSPAHGSVSAALNPSARRKKKFRQNNSSPGNSPQVKHWNCESHDAAAPRPNSISRRTFGDQRSSPSSPAHGSVSAAVNPSARRKKKFRQNNSSPGIPPQEEDWDLEISVVVQGQTGVVSASPQDWTLKHPLPGCYTPAVHHVKPVRWVHHSAPIEPDQFEDADESPETAPRVEDRDCEVQDAAKKTTPVTADGQTGVVGVSPQDWTLKHPLPGCYTPAVHHVKPVRWVHHSAPIEPDQFEDADE